MSIYFSKLALTKKQVQGRFVSVVFFVLLGLGSGVIATALLAALYAGHSPWSLTRADLAATPLVAYLVPLVVGLLVGRAAAAGAHQEQSQRRAWLVGNLLGCVGGVLVYVLWAVPGHGFFIHLVAGAIGGGGLGWLTGFAGWRLKS